MKPIPFILFLFLGFSALWGATAKHELYLMVSLTQDFTIGKRVQSESGLYLIEDRETPRHIGFHHPRLDRGDTDPRNPDRLYIAALNGILGTGDGGKTWKILTSWDMTEGKDVKVDPFNPDTIYAALPDGIGVSRDRGESWVYSDKGIDRKYTQVLAPDRGREGWILAGTELGIYRSQDGGENWELAQATSATVLHLEQSPHNPKHYIAATQADGVWISRNRGRKWVQLLPGEEEKSFHYARFHPTDPGVLSVSGWGYGLMISRNVGSDWEAVEGLKSDRVWSHAHDPDFKNRIYACLYRDTVHVSDDLGETWAPFIFPSATVWEYLFVPKAGQTE